MSIQLTVVSLDRDAEELPRVSTFSGGEITLGRDQTNDVVLDSPAVASHHARIRIEGDSEDDMRLFITDLGSSTGVLVEDERIEPMVEVALPINKRFTIGSFLIKPSGERRDRKQRKRRSLLPFLTQEIEAEEYGADEIVIEEPQPSTGSFETAHDPLVERTVIELDARDVITPQEEDSIILACEPDAFSDESGLDGEEVVLEEADLSGAPEAVRADEAPVTSVSAAEEFSPDPVLHAVVQAAEGIAAAPEETADIRSSGSDPLTVDGHFESVEITVDGSDVVDLDFIATELFTVRGAVLHKGSPLEGVTITAGELGETTTDSSGMWSFGDVLDGTSCTVTPMLAGYIFEPAAKELAVDAADAALDFTAIKLLTISGKVIHKGVPLEGVEIDGGPLGTTITAADGSYAFHNVPDGSVYSLTARKGNYVFGTMQGRPK